LRDAERRWRRHLDQPHSVNILASGRAEQNRLLPFVLAKRANERCRSDAPAMVEAAGIAGLRKPLLPTELPPTEREMVLQVGRAVMDVGARRATVAQREFENLLVVCGKQINDYPARREHA
jgi:hypothetical protein